MPPVYGRLNSRRFAVVLYRSILNGSAEQLAVIAEELLRSIDSLIFFANNQRNKRTQNSDLAKLKEVESYANDILLLISDPRFCRAIVGNAPTTALAVFEDVVKYRKFDLPISTFAKNIVMEAMANQNSFLFNESDGYEVGLLGYHKPLTSVLFGNFELVEKVPELLDPDGVGMIDWNSRQWEAYCRVMLLALEDCASKGFLSHTAPFARAISHLSSALRDLYKLNNATESDWKGEHWAKLRVIVDFAKDAKNLLDKHPFQEGVRRRRPTGSYRPETVYDLIAQLEFELVYAASSISSPRDVCWSVQHNTVWSQLFCFGGGHGNASNIIDFKFRRLVFDEIKRLQNFLNFKGGRILGFCLNVMGFEVSENELHANVALQRAILSWTRANFSMVHKKNSRVVDAWLVDGMIFDETRSRLERTYPVDGLRIVPCREYFEVDRAAT